MPYRNNTAYDSAIYWLQRNVRGARPSVRSASRVIARMPVRRSAARGYYRGGGGYTLRSRDKPGYKSYRQRRRIARRRRYYRRKASKKRTWSKRGLIKYVKAKLHVENKRRSVNDTNWTQWNYYMMGQTGPGTMTRDSIGTTTMWSFGLNGSSAGVPLLQNISEGTGSGQRVGQEIYVKHISIWMRISMDTPCDPYPQHFRLLLVRQNPSTALAFDEVYFPATRTLHAKYKPYEHRVTGEEFKALWSKDYTFAPGRVAGCSVDPDGDDVKQIDSAFEKWYRIKVPVNRKVRYAAGAMTESDGWNTMLYMNQINHNYSNIATSTSNYLKFQVQQMYIHFTDV